MIVGLCILLLMHIVVDDDDDGAGEYRDMVFGAVLAGETDQESNGTASLWIGRSEGDFHNAHINYTLFNASSSVQYVILKAHGQEIYNLQGDMNVYEYDFDGVSGSAGFNVEARHLAYFTNGEVYFEVQTEKSIGAESRGRLVGVSGVSDLGGEFELPMNNYTNANGTAIIT